MVDQLQDEKRDAIRQMNDMQEEFEEMQDGFREIQADEFASLKKELDDASKNCRLLQFKLRKVEKRSDQLEAEKKELEQRLENTANSAKIAKLEEELKKAKIENEKLMKTKDSLSVTGLKKKSPVLTKAPSGEVGTNWSKFSYSSSNLLMLTCLEYDYRLALVIHCTLKLSKFVGRAFLQTVEPPMPPDFDAHKIMRDLQSALERESDLREQLKFAEEEAASLRQKVNKINS